MEKKLFYQVGESDKPVIPASEMVAKLLAQSKETTIKCGNSVVPISSEAILKINSLDLAKQQRVRELLFNALQDTSKITVETKQNKN